VFVGLLSGAGAGCLRRAGLLYLGAQRL